MISKEQMNAFMDRIFVLTAEPNWLENEQVKKEVARLGEIVWEYREELPKMKLEDLTIEEFNSIIERDYTRKEIAEACGVTVETFRCAMKKKRLKRLIEKVDINSINDKKLIDEHLTQMNSSDASRRTARTRILSTLKWLQETENGIDEVYKRMSASRYYALVRYLEDTIKMNDKEAVAVSGAK